MALATYSANELVYTISQEPDAPLGSLSWALIHARLIDELTALTPEGDIEIESPFPFVSPRVGLGGIAGLAGTPERSFPALATHDYTVPMSIHAEGYIDLSLNVPVLHIAGFPGAFVPVDLGDLSLHRIPIAIAGRVTLRSAAGIKPVVGATVSMTGLWRTLPPANLNPPPDPPNVLSLAPRMYQAQTAAGSVVTGGNLAGAPGPDKQLVLDAPAGATSVRLSDRVGIAVGDLLAIDTNQAALTEFIAIQAIAGFAADNLPATVTLRWPLRLVHRPGSVAHKVTFAPLGAPTSLSADAAVGDACMFLTAPGNLAGAPLVSIVSGANPAEYHQVSAFSVVSDAEGFYRLPPLTRVAQCVVEAHDGAHPNIDTKFCPDYSADVNRLDFVYQ